MVELEFEKEDKKIKAKHTFKNLIHGNWANIVFMKIKTHPLVLGIKL